MGTRGPIGMTAHEAKRRGSYRADRHGDKRTSPGEPPERPDWLTGEAGKVWDDLLPRLIEAGIPLVPVDAFALGRYCTMLEWWRACEADIESNGATFVNNRGREVERPAVRRAAKLADALLKMEQAFGMTPPARARLPLIAPKPDGEDSSGIELYFNPRLCKP